MWSGSSNGIVRQVLRPSQAGAIARFGLSSWHRARIAVGKLMSRLNAHTLKENIFGEQ
jgi:hypothetical protein